MDTKPRMKPVRLTLLLALAMMQGVHAQDGLIFDQQSSADETAPSLPGIIRYGFGVGQSFTPTLDRVDFFRVNLYDIDPYTHYGTTLVGILHSNTINGPMLGLTHLNLKDGFSGPASFVFSNSIPVTPGVEYFFTIAVRFNEQWGISIRNDSHGYENYPGGEFYNMFIPEESLDLWFREGVIVPEVSSISIVLMGGVAAIFLARRKIGNP